MKQILIRLAVAIGGCMAIVELFDVTKVLPEHSKPYVGLALVVVVFIGLMLKGDDDEQGESEATMLTSKRQKHKPSRKKAKRVIKEDPLETTVDDGMSTLGETIGSLFQIINSPEQDEAEENPFPDIPMGYHRLMCQEAYLSKRDYPTLNWQDLLREYPDRTVLYLRVLNPKLHDAIRCPKAVSRDKLREYLNKNGQDTGIFPGGGNHKYHFNSEVGVATWVDPVKQYPKFHPFDYENSILAAEDDGLFHLEGRYFRYSDGRFQEVDSEGNLLFVDPRVVTKLEEDGLSWLRIRLGKGKGKVSDLTEEDFFFLDLSLGNYITQNGEVIPEPSKKGLSRDEEIAVWARKSEGMAPAAQTLTEAEIWAKSGS